MILFCIKASAATGAQTPPKTRGSCKSGRGPGGMPGIDKGAPTQNRLRRHPCAEGGPQAEDKAQDRKDEQQRCQSGKHTRSRITVNHAFAIIGPMMAMIAQNRFESRALDQTLKPGGAQNDQAFTRYERRIIEHIAHRDQGAQKQGGQQKPLPPAQTCPHGRICFQVFHSQTI